MLHSAYELVNLGKNIHLLYNKFGPVNCMHFMKCGVNSSLHNSGCCRRSVVTWITVLSQHTEFTKRVLYKFNFLRFSVKQGTIHRPTSHLVHLYTVPFLCQREEHRHQHSSVDDFVGQCLLWRLSIRKTFFAPTLGLPTNLGLGWSWLFPASSIKFLTRRSLKSQWAIFSPTWR